MIIPPVHARRVNWKELKRPPGNIRRPTGLKIACFGNGPVRPGYGRLASASEGHESKLLFHQRNKQVVAVRTHNSGFHRVANGRAPIDLLPASAC